MLEFWEHRAYLLCPCIHFFMKFDIKHNYYKATLTHGSWGIIVSVVTRLLAGQSEVQILAGELYFISKTFHTCSGAHSISYSVDTGGSFNRAKLVRL